MKTAFFTCMLTLSVIASLSIAQNVKPTTKPSDKSAKDQPLNPVLQKAVDELAREMEAVIASPAKADRKTKCEYLKSQAGQVDQKDLVDALSRRLNKHAAVDSYIKWQLLSVQETQFDESYLKQMVDLYRRLPVPPARLGSSQETEQQLQQSIKSLTEEKKDEIDKINKQWSEKVGQQEKVFLPMIELRNELYARLPKTTESVRAGLDDVQARTDAGYETDPFLKKVAGDLRVLAAGMKPIEVKQWITLLQHVSGKTGPYFYKKVRVNSKSKKAEWDHSKTGFDKKICETLVEDLSQMIK